MESLTLPEKMAIEEAVAQALGRRKRESLGTAARRVLKGRKGHRAWHIAWIVVYGKGDPWFVLSRAAQKAQKLIVVM